MDEEKFLKIDELCERFHLKKEAVLELVKKEEIPFNRTSQGWLRFWSKDAELWYQGLSKEQKKALAPRPRKTVKK